MPSCSSEVGNPTCSMGAYPFGTGNPARRFRCSEQRPVETTASSVHWLCRLCPATTATVSSKNGVMTDLDLSAPI
jgi:hypothetical protein